MSQQRRLTIMRFALEGLAIVVSILVAFAIDAWWDARSERRLESSYLAGLSRDLAGAVAEADGDLHSRYATQDHVSRLLQVGNGHDAPSSDSIALMIGVLRYSSKYAPPTAILDDLISSGRTDLIRSDSIRIGLARFLQQLDKVVIEEQEEREFIAQRLSLHLAERMDLAPSYRRSSEELDDPLIAVADDLQGLLTDQEFRNLLFERAELNRVPQLRIAALRSLSVQLLEWLALERGG